MYYLDSFRDKDGSEIYRTKAGFRYPLSKDRNGQYKVKSGEMTRVCMTSDFFLEEEDEWGWQIPEEKLYKPYFGPRCQNCGMRLACNGCSRCGKCESTAGNDLLRA